MLILEDTYYSGYKIIYIPLVFVMNFLSQM